MTIQSLTLRFTTGTPPTQVTTTQEIPLSSINLSGSNVVPITDSGILAAFNTQPAGTSCIPSIIATYNDPNLGEGEGTIIVSTTSVQNFVPNKITPTLSLGSISDKFANDLPFQLVVTSPSDGIKTYSSSNTSVAEVNSSGLVTLKGIEGTITINVYQAASANGVYTAATSVSTQLVVLAPSVTRASNNTTIQYTTINPLASEPLFIQANPRGTGVEWFAVVTNDSKAQITSYANNEQNGINYFTKSGHSQPVIFNNIVTTRMTDMSELFINASQFDQLISSWDTSRVTNMGIMFGGATLFNQNIGYWNTANVTNMNNMFGGATLFNNSGNTSIGSWVTSNVTNMGGMFNGAAAFNQNIGAWNVSSVTNMSFMFYNARAFNQNIGAWNTSNVQGMSYMFNGATAFNKNISTWNVGFVTPIPPTDFRTGSALTQANTPSGFFLELASNNTTIQYTLPSIASEPLFIQANPRGTGSEWFAVVNDSSKAQITSYAKNEQNGINYFTKSGHSQPVIFNNIVTTLMTDMSYMNFATTFNGDISSWDVSNVTNMFKMFEDAHIFNQPLNNWNVANVVNMGAVFSGARTFNQDISLWNVANVTSMNSMFYDARVFNQNIGSWVTSKVTNMDYMFSYATLFNQNISAWNVGFVTPNPPTDFRTGSALTQANTPSGFFLELALNNTTIQYTLPSIASEPLFIQANPRGTGVEWFAVVTNASKAQITSYAKNEQNGINYFTKSGHSQPVIFNNIVTTRMTDMSLMFNNAIEFDEIIYSWDTSSVTNMTNMFKNAYQFDQNIGAWNVANVTSMNNMFYDARVFNQDIGSWVTSSVINMSNMFGSATLFNNGGDISINSWDTSSVTNMSFMFSNAEAFNKNIGSWVTSSVTNMNYMFFNAAAFNNGVSSSIGNWNTSSVTNMSFMFYGATAFNKNIGAWNVSSVTNMNSMFQGATAFNQNISAWNVGLVTPIPPTEFRTGSALTQANTPSGFFLELASNNTTIQYTTINPLASEPLFIQANPRGTGSEWFAVVTNASKAQITSYANNEQNGINYFTKSGHSQPVIFNNIVTTRMTDMSYMFNFATTFNGDISSWDVSNVTNMISMFLLASAFNQNIGAWDVSNVINMNSMFNNATAFNNNNSGSIGAWDVSNVENMNVMFNRATAFNQNIGAWNVSSVTNMTSMFENAKAFNQNIGAWDVSSVTDMNFMFYGATAFNKNLSGWDVGLVTPIPPTEFRTGSALTAANTPSGFVSWNQKGGNINGDAEDDQSGRSVSLSSDGTILAIGANNNDGNGTNSGHVRVFIRDTNEALGWKQLGGDIEGEAAADQSGHSVSLSSDGTIVAIGAYYNGQGIGHVRVFIRDTNVVLGWRQLGGDINGENLTNYSGISVSLSSDGTIVAIGAFGSENFSGHVRVYKRDTNVALGWIQLGGDIDGEAAGDQSGRSVSLSSDGTIVAIGARCNAGNGSNSGHVRVFIRNPTKTTAQMDQSLPNFGPIGWTRLGGDIDGEAADNLNGYSVSLSSDGTIVAIGAIGNAGNGVDAGRVRVYKRDTNEALGWKQLGADIDGEAASDNSGISVSLSSDGNIVAIGANGNAGNGSNSGRVRVYKRDTNEALGWRQLGGDINGEAAGDLSGYSVSLSSDGTILAVGSPYNDGNGVDSGHVRVFKFE